jgi:hypothetical protein
VVIGAGSFGTAVAVLLARGGLEEWVAHVRATLPAPVRFDSGALWWRVRRAA